MFWNKKKKPELVEYLGITMTSDWPEQIEASQKIKNYIIEGKECKRIKYGDKRENDSNPEKYPCHDCAVPVGYYHVASCDAEVCPKCNEQAISCNCDYDLNADANKNINNERSIAQSYLAGKK